MFRTQPIEEKRYGVNQMAAEQSYYLSMIYIECVYIIFLFNQRF